MDNDPVFEIGYYKSNFVNHDRTAPIHFYIIKVNRCSVLVSIDDAQQPKNCKLRKSIDNNLYFVHDSTCYYLKCSKKLT